MVSGVGAIPETTPSAPTGFEDIDDLRDAREPDGLEELDRRLAALCREQGPLRAVLASIAWHLVDRRAWERLGYARLCDYAVERLGLSARSVQSLARVGRAFYGRPALEQALVSGRLGWTKVRLLAGLPAAEEDEARWIARAERVSAESLARQVRAVDRGSVEAGAADDASRRSRLLEVRCTPEVRWKWATARGVASRAAGHMLPLAEAAELIAAEVLSALPVDETAHVDEVEGEDAVAPSGDPVGASDAELRPGWERPAASALTGVDAELRRLLDGVEDADAFGLDERLRRALVRERRLEARIAPLLVLVWGRGVHRALGFTTREGYARERLGMDATRARALVRLERACAETPPLAHAWRTGALSWVKAALLVPLVSADPLGRFVPGWVSWAGRVTVRRLREDAERALAVAETDPEAFRRDGGLPPEARRRPADAVSGAVARPDREIRARHRDSLEVGQGADREGDEREREEREGEREIGATHRNGQGEHEGADRRGVEACAGAERGIGAPDRESRGDASPGVAHSQHGRASARLDGRPRADETCEVRLIAPAEVIRLFRAVLCTVRRRIERDTGRLPTPGEALGVMLDHAFASWGIHDGAKVAARHRVFARDGWRCVAPGCTSMRNLHDHHIRFRSAGGSDAPENRVTLCAFHHLRGVHAGRLGCAGRAPDGLTWRLGIRPGAPPLLGYRSGDVRTTPAC
jgi:hypothetical protein